MSTTIFNHVALRLEGHHPLEILHWAADCFAPWLTFATGFGVEGCVLIDLIGRYRLPIDLFTLDTGLLFPETYQLWQQLEERYDITIRGIAPAWTVEEQAQRAGAELWKSNAARWRGQEKTECGLHTHWATGTTTA